MTRRTDLRIVLAAAAAAIAALAGCAERKEAKTLARWDGYQENIAEADFKVPPGAKLYPGYVDLYETWERRRYPANRRRPLVAVYRTSAPLTDVAQFYAAVYGVEASAAAPVRARLEDTAASLRQALEQAGRKLDTTALRGEFEAVHFPEGESLPKADLTRPFFDVLENRVVDETLIVLSKAPQR